MLTVLQRIHSISFRFTGYLSDIGKQKQIQRVHPKKRLKSLMMKEQSLRQNIPKNVARYNYDGKMYISWLRLSLAPKWFLYSWPQQLCDAVKYQTRNDQFFSRMKMDDVHLRHRGKILQRCQQGRPSHFVPINVHRYPKLYMCTLPSPCFLCFGVYRFCVLFYSYTMQQHILWPWWWWTIIIFHNKFVLRP